MPRRSKKIKKISTAWLCAALAVLTVAVGLGATFATGNLPSFDVDNIMSMFSRTEESSESGPPDIEVHNPQVPIEVVQKDMPSEMRAATIKANREFPLDDSNDNIKSAIDKAINDALDLTMNTLIIDPVSEDGIRAYNSATLEGITYLESFNPVTYAIDAAKAAGMYTAVIYNITDCISEQDIMAHVEPSNSLIDNLRSQLKEFLKIADADMILLDGYYNVSTDYAYINYLNGGSGIGMQEHMMALPASFIEVACEEINTSAAGINIGLMTEAVWANNYEHENGSDTTALFSTLADGNTDTLEILETGLIDFATIKASGSLEDENIPYEQVIAWWDSQLSDRDIPMYIIHSSDKAITEAVGWSQYDQLPKQISVGKSSVAYQGSIFNSLERLSENPEESTDKLVSYFAGSITEEQIFTDLEITSPDPKILEFTSFSDQVSFTGNTDPNTDATINDVKITTDENGYFYLNMPLVEGYNKFSIVHKGTTIVYDILRVIEVVKEVTPTGTLNVDGSTKLTITAVAYTDATVYAVINGQTISMKLQEESADESLRGTSYSRYTGVYTVPAATTEIQNIGSIEVFGEWEGYEKSKGGAAIVINARALPSDGRPVVISSEWAVTYPADTMSRYTEPEFLPLPEGALDYAEGNKLSATYYDDYGNPITIDFYKLASGVRVLADDITTVSDEHAPVDNVISGLTVDSDDRYTTITLATQQQVSYVAKYSVDAVTFDFSFTNSVPDGIKLTKNPLFSNLTFKDSKMTLRLKSENIFFGYSAKYNNDGNLVLKFNNPPVVSGSKLNDVKIVLDPGHGGTDPGALGYSISHPERVVNWAVSNKLADILEDRGADVVVLPTQNHNYSVQQREQMTVDENPHLFISVHSNSAKGNPNAVGSEAYYFTPFSYLMAVYSSENMAEAIDSVNRKAKPGLFYVTRNTQYPSVLVEMGFMSNRNEYSKLVNSEYQDRLADAIADSISDYFIRVGVNANAATGTQTSGTMKKASPQPQQQDPEDDPKDDPEDDPPDDPEDDPPDDPGGDLGDRLIGSDTEIILSVGEEDVFWVELESGEETGIKWKAEGESGIARLVFDSDPTLINIEALKPGKVVIIARAEIDERIMAYCTIIVK